MRALLAAALLFVSTFAVADDSPKPLSIAIEPLGDGDRGVVTRIFFRFANPHAITDAGLFLEGSITEAGHVPRNFRFPVPRKDDKWVWDKSVYRNDKLIRSSRWAVLPDKRNEMSYVHTFAEGEAEIDVWLVLEADYGAAPRLIAHATETFTLAKTNRPFVLDAAEEEPAVAEEVVPQESGAVTIRAARRNELSKLFTVSVDVLPPVKRVEFRIGDRKVLARNSSPYTAELDLGEQRVAVRAIGFDVAGRYVDADAFVANDNETRIGVTITRIATSDGLTHFKLSVRNPAGTPLKSIVLYAGDKKLHEWTRPPFALSVPTADLTGVDRLRASVIDETGSEASDELILH